MESDKSVRQTSPRQIGRIDVEFTNERERAPLSGYQPICPTEEEAKMLNTFVGDGAAKVTISQEISDKNYGRGVSVMCSITLTVNQDDATVDTAMAYGRTILNEKIADAVGQLNAIYEEFKAHDARR